MKLALNTYRDRINAREFEFARQCGCSGVVTALIDFNKSWIGGSGSVPLSEANDPIWEYESLADIARTIRGTGLEWYAIENFNPADWCDVLLDGPRKQAQMDRLKCLIRDVGRAGVRYFGYNFSLAGVYGRTLEQVARGGAASMCFDADRPDLQDPIPKGQVWDMVYDTEAPEGFMDVIDNEELWQRCRWFLEQIVPVAEEAGVMVCAHPDDPPVPRLRGNARLIYRLDMFQRLVDMVPSPNSGIELCLGTMQEMADGEIYDTVGSLAAQKKVAYVHLRNVRGKVPHYEEVFIDEGDLDVVRVLKALRDNGYEGPVVPDHVPDLNTDDPWHSSMAFALGYIRAVLRMLDAE